MFHNKVPRVNFDWAICAGCLKNGNFGKKLHNAQYLMQRSLFKSLLIPAVEKLFLW